MNTAVIERSSVPDKGIGLFYVHYSIPNLGTKRESILGTNLEP